MIRRSNVLLLAVIALGFTLGAAWRTDADRESERRLARELSDLRRITSELVRPHTRFSPSDAADAGPNRLRVLPLDDLLTPTPHYSPPLPPGEWPDDKNQHGFASMAEERRLPFGTIDEVIELLRGLDERAWAEAPTLAAAGPRTLLAWQRPAIMDAMVEFLDNKMRPHAHRSALLETDLFELDAELALRVRGEREKELAPGTIEAIARAIDAGGAKRIFSSRAISLLGQRSLFWHGRQRARVHDADVEVAASARTSDPNVEILQTGGSVSARVQAGRDGARVSIDLAFGHSVAGTVEMRDTADASRLQMPSWKFTRTNVALDLRSGRWGVALVAEGGHGRARALLVRATVLERTGGLR